MLAAKIAVTDCRIPRECAYALKARGFETVPLPPHPALPPPVASHPDMLLFVHGFFLLSSRDYYTLARSEIDMIAGVGRLTLILTDETPGEVYPRDILFNAAPIGGFIFARADSISHHISKICNLSGAKIINVRQGYTRCSTVIADEHSIITSDAGIASAARAAGLEVLLVSPGHIALKGYDTGFIGGASGVFDGTVYFCGDIDAHPDASAIRDFCAARGLRVVSLGGGSLTDVGTIFFI